MLSTMGPYEKKSNKKAESITALLLNGLKIHRIAKINIVAKNAHDIPIIIYLSGNSLKFFEQKKYIGSIANNSG